MMSYSRPNNRAAPARPHHAAGTGPRYHITLDGPLDAADTIEFWTSSGHFAQTAGCLTYEGAEHEFVSEGIKVSVKAELLG